MRQLTSLDQQFLALEDGRTHGHVSALGIYDPRTTAGHRLDVTRVRRLVGNRLHLLPTFRWRLVTVPLSLDYDYWVDDDAVDLSYHVRELALPAPGDRRQLAEQVARIVSRPLDRTHPLWELYVIEGLQDGAVALLIKMHHATVDGISGGEVMSYAARRNAQRAPASYRRKPLRRTPSRGTRAARPRSDRNAAPAVASAPRIAPNSSAPRRGADDPSASGCEVDRPHQPGRAPFARARRSGSTSRPS